MNDTRTNICNSDAILAIDDNWLVLNSFKRLLETEGWVVHIAANPTEGISLYQAHWREIKLVLLDYSMGQLRGDAVFEQLKRINQDVRVILISGSSGDFATRMLEKGLWGFMQKPVEPEDLIDRVREAIPAFDQQILNAA
jgi:two-component system, cell cycle sensor histidine kinase and response regulator CckA